MSDEQDPPLAFAIIIGVWLAACVGLVILGVVWDAWAPVVLSLLLMLPMGYVLPGGER